MTPVWSSRVARFGLLTVMALAQLHADLVLINGNIWTGNDAQPRAQAVACRRGRILAVGANQEIRKWVTPTTQVVDLQGKLVLPGFNDAHVHMFQGGASLTSVQLRDARSEAQFRDRIRDYAAKLPKGRWVVEGRWDHENWLPARLPTRSLIDEVTPQHPVFVSRLDGHMALANSVALKLAGITRQTPDPPGGAIVRDENGEPTGVLRDSAMDPVSRLLPPPGPQEIAEALRAAMHYAAQNGVTSVQDMSASPDVLAAYQTLEQSGELTVRVYGHQPLPEWQSLARVGVRSGFGSEKLKIGGLKGFADGSLGATTALFFEPYNDASNTSGLLSDEMIPESKMLGNIVGADRAGLQVAVHAIGEKANHLILKMFAEASRRNGLRDRRFRIEHAQHLRREDIPHFGQQAVIASMQPYHAIDDGRWAEKRIGAERAKGTYAFRALLDSGAKLAFGSDWPVEPISSLLGIFAAVTRRTLDDRHPGGWVPEQKITVAEAVRAYTAGSAYASFEEGLKGSIAAGKLADMVVISHDILSINPTDIEKARVVMTIFDGKVIYAL